MLLLHLLLFFSKREIFENGGIVEVVLSSVFSKILKIRVVVVVVVVEYDEWS